MRPAVAAVLFACLLLTLAATSSPRVVGDGSEYVHLAARIASGHLPGAGESRHFIFYSALAAPLVALGRPLGLETAAAFTILNGLLLLAAFYLAASRLHWTFCAIVFAGPILWWLDKPHTEPFTFALYAVAFSLFASAPWWSLVAVGAAATQNPGNAALIGILAVAAAAGKASLLKDRRFWLGLAAGTVLAALHPAYYLVRLGTPTRLVSAGDLRWVTWQEYRAVLVDPNIGLLPQVPIYGAAVLVGPDPPGMARAAPPGRPCHRRGSGVRRVAGLRRRDGRQRESRRHARPEPLRHVVCSAGHPAVPGA